MDEPLDYLCFIYYNEERVLSDIIYGYKEFRDYPPSVQEDLISQLHFKSVLEMTILKPKDMDRL